MSNRRIDAAQAVRDRLFHDFDRQFGILKSEGYDAVEAYEIMILAAGYLHAQLTVTYATKEYADPCKWLEVFQASLKQHQVNMSGCLQQNYGLEIAAKGKSLH